MFKKLLFAVVLLFGLVPAIQVQAQAGNEFDSFRNQIFNVRVLNRFGQEVGDFRFVRRQDLIRQDLLILDDESSFYNQNIQLFRLYRYPVPNGEFLETEDY